MTRHRLTIVATAAAFALSLAPVWAQDKGQASPPPASSGSADKGSAAPAAGSRSGDTVGSAMPRGGDTSSSSSSSSSGSTMSGTFGSGGSSTMGAMPGTWSGPSGRLAPERPMSMNSDDAQRRGGGGSATGRAMPRGGNSGSTSGSATTATSGGGSRPAGGHERTAVPPYSRPRDGRTVTGTVATRTTPLLDPEHRGYTTVYDPYYYGYYDPYYSRYGYNSGYSPYWMPSYGFGFGYFAYDPFLFGAGFYDPYSSGYGSYGYGGGSGSYQVRYRDAGSLRLKVKPSDAQVYIDGYYVGVIDSFDGMFQRLNIDAGTHKVELRAEGYEPVQFEVMVPPGETITYKGELKRIH